MHGSWQSALPSRFIKEIPEELIDATVDDSLYGGYAGFRDNENAASFGSSYESPGWKRAQATAPPPAASAAARRRSRRRPGACRPPIPAPRNMPATTASSHQKFGCGRVRYVEGNKLTVDFDKAGEKRVY